VRHCLRQAVLYKHPSNIRRRSASAADAAAAAAVAFRPAVLVCSSRVLVSLRFSACVCITQTRTRARAPSCFVCECRTKPQYASLVQVLHVAYLATYALVTLSPPFIRTFSFCVCQVQVWRHAAWLCMYLGVCTRRLDPAFGPGIRGRCRWPMHRGFYADDRHAGRHGRPERWIRSFFPCLI
jgi:hypothetical protein